MIFNALEDKPLLVYGNGQQIRNWLRLEEHSRAPYTGVTVDLGGAADDIGEQNEKANFEVVYAFCEILDELVSRNGSASDFGARDDVGSVKELINYVAERLCHDQRHAIDARRIQKNLGWIPKKRFESGLRKTVEWYLNNHNWYQRVQCGDYQRQRLGITERKIGIIL